MPVLAVVLVLVAAVVHASWNVLVKQSGGGVQFALSTSLVEVVLWGPVGLWFAARDCPGYGPLQWALVTGSGALHVLYFVTLLTGYQRSDLTVVYPVARGTGPLLTAIVASLVLDEHLGLLGWVGVGGVVGGIVLLAGRPTSAPGDRVRAGIGYGLATGVLVAAYTLVDGYAVKHAGVSPILADYLGNIVRIPLTVALLAVWPEPTRFVDEARRTWKPALVVAAIAPLGYVLVLFAATIAPLSRVAPARELSMLFAALLGGRLLGEGDRGRRIAGAALTAAGVIALALPA